MHHHDDPHDEAHDRGLSYDLSTLVNRRRLLALLGGAGAAALVACTTDVPGPTARTRPPAISATPTKLEPIPAEGGGPFPADGSNGVNVLNRSGIVRSDITSSFGGPSAVAAGVPLAIRLTVLDLRGGGASLEGAAVYVWQCDREGRYSLYSQGVTDENYLRGVQATDADGSVTFTSIFPGAYSGRWPHVHFEVYPDLAAAAAGRDKLRTSQLALPEDACREVYATSGYGPSLGNLGRLSLADDAVFRDGWSQQLGTVTGDVASGLTVSLDVWL